LFSTLFLQSLQLAGVEVLEARIIHLAYSSEIITSSMLQRQQAKAVLSARKVIVDGEISMVKSAIDQLTFVSPLLTIFTKVE
jgi:hypothetical protein